MQTIEFEGHLHFLSLFMVMMVHKRGSLRTGSQICTLVQQETAPFLIIPSELRSILKMVLYTVHMYTKMTHQWSQNPPIWMMFKQDRTNYFLDDQIHLTDNNTTQQSIKDYSSSCAIPKINVLKQVCTRKCDMFIHTSLKSVKCSW